MATLGCGRRHVVSSSIRAHATSAADSATTLCRRCGAQHSAFTFFCLSCDRLMEADYGTTSHFELLDIHPQFVLNLTEVDDAYKRLQRKLHPDHFTQSDEEDQALAQAHSTRVNEAVSVLRSPIRRAGYWMELHGARVLEEDQRMGDAETMMEVMEVSEEIEEATTQHQIDSLARQNDDKVREVEDKLNGIFGKKDWDGALRFVERLQMLVRLRERMNDWQPPRQ